MIVRRLVHGMGYRYRLHVGSLPGKSDIVLPRLNRIIDVRGCFWHQHAGCIDSHIAKSRVQYWEPKLARNQRRDEETPAGCANLGGKCVWFGSAKRRRRANSPVDSLVSLENPGEHNHASKSCADAAEEQNVIPPGGSQLAIPVE